MPPKALTQDQRDLLDQVHALVAAFYDGRGMSLDEIAAVLPWSASTINEKVRRGGGVIRPRGNRPKD